jgi:DNA-binding MarR family transcriptional regulator
MLRNQSIDCRLPVAGGRDAARRASSGPDRPQLRDKVGPLSSLPRRSFTGGMDMTILEPLVFATNTLSRRLDEHIVETGLLAVDYLVLEAVRRAPGGPAAQIRRSLGIRDAAFSALVARMVHRGYVVEGSWWRDRRTRSLELSLPGDRATRIASSINQELEDRIGGGPSLLALYEHLVALGRSVGSIPCPELLEDGLPAITA